MLKAGYLEDWDHHDTLSGVPQGGVVSPILSNIYLDKLDTFVEQELIPPAGGRPAQEGTATWRPRRGPPPGEADAHAPLHRPDGPRLPPPPVREVRG